MFYVYVLKYPGEGRFRAGVTEDPRKFGARRGQRESSRAASRDGSRLVFLEAYRERGPARLRSSELERRRLAFARLRKHGENRFDAARRRGAPAGTLSGCPAEIKRRAQNGQERINTAYYNITSGCNLKCRHCYAGNAEQGSVTAEENKRILSSLKKLGVESLVLLGGEPFCHPDLPGILAAAVEEGFDEIIIVTNGTLLPGGALDLIRRHGIKVRVSLD
ncbi:MAG TPA: radical SAM protein, partial [Elusimicrobiales bacterium]|nr:radical SAM protein [Elusimicrobiales bacterium]